MKAILIAAGILGITAAAASAQPMPRWEQGQYPYARHHHQTCMDKARRLHGFERRASADGRLSHREREIIRALRRDLDSTCGRFRWRW